MRKVSKLSGRRKGSVSRAITRHGQFSKEEAQAIKFASNVGETVDTVLQAVTRCLGHKKEKPSATVHASPNSKYCGGAL